MSECVLAGAAQANAIVIQITVVCSYVMSCVLCMLCLTLYEYNHEYTHVFFSGVGYSRSCCVRVKCYFSSVRDMRHSLVCLLRALNNLNIDR